jgi:hypothetical protein
MFWRRVAQFFVGSMLLGVPLLGQTAKFNFVSIDVGGLSRRRCEASTSMARLSAFIGWRIRRVRFKGHHFQCLVVMCADSRSRMAGW